MKIILGYNGTIVDGIKIQVQHTNICRYGNKCFSIIGPRIFNKLPLHVTSSISTESFKQSLKTYLFLLSENDLENLYN